LLIVIVMVILMVVSAMMIGKHSKWLTFFVLQADLPLFLVATGVIVVDISY